MFPTTWAADDIDELSKMVDVREVDLLIIGSEVELADNWPCKTHVICFSDQIDMLPDPTNKGYMSTSEIAETEEFLLPDVPLELSRQRQSDFENLSSVRGWARIALQLRISTALAAIGVARKEHEEATNTLNTGAIITEIHTSIPLATTFIRKHSNLGVAWLPNKVFNQSLWVELLVTRWAQTDKERLPNFADWASTPEWMVPEEETLTKSIQELAANRERTIAQIDKKIAEMTASLREATKTANSGLRRLITAQNDELVSEVASVLKKIGFSVELVDETLEDNVPKREDIRLRDPSDKMWEAIVEVRGYARSGGTTADLMRLNRFANLYLKEKERLPDKRIYVANGQLDLIPSQRQSPLASADEDVKVFAEEGGLIIWTLDLFKVAKATTSINHGSTLASIKESVGRWCPQ